VVKAGEGALDIPRHRHVAGSGFVILFEGETDVAATAGPVGGTLVFFLQNFEETVKLRFVSVADPKNDEGEHDVAVFVFPKARGDGAWGKAARGKVLDEGVVAQFARLRKAVHAFSDFGVNVAIVNEGLQVVEVNNFLGDQVHRDAHIFIFW
jgi:hypothetical protein